MSGPVLAPVILIRPAAPADGPGIARVRAAAWEAAYAGMIPADRLAELATPEAVAWEGDWRAAHPMDGYLVAQDQALPAPAARGHAAPDQAGLDQAGLDQAGLDQAGLDQGAAAPGRAGTCGGRIVGFASFGPERGEDDVPGERLLGPPDQDRAELYAIYVLPGRWSGGTGRALLERTLRLVAEAGYAEISTWALEGNARGRRLYEEAGFRATGESAVLARLGGVTEVRYRRAVS